MTSPVISERHSDVVTVTINRPERGNTLDLTLLKELCSILRSLEKDPGLRAVCLTGAGDKAFSLGLDLDDLAKTRDEEKAKVFRYAMQAFEILSGLQCLTAAFVNGDCLGVALGLALSTDYRLVSSRAGMGAPDVNHGLFPYLVSKIMVGKLGSSTASALAFGGKVARDLECLAMGLASEVVREEDFHRRLRELRLLWAASDVGQLRQGKQVLRGNPSQETLMLYLGESMTRRRT